MFSKTKNLVAFLVVLAVAAVTVEADTWCSCSDSKLGRTTQDSCSYAGGNYDGSSCGMDTTDKVNKFSTYCAYNPNPKGHPNDAGTVHCWN